MFQILKIRDDWAYKLVSKEAAKSADKQKKQYDKKARNSTLEVGDRILVRRTSFQGKHKLSNRWEKEPYVVHAKPNDEIPVYVVKRESDGLEKTLHRNMLLPIMSLPVRDQPKTQQPEKVKEQSVMEPTSKMQGEITDKEDIEKDEEDQLYMLVKNETDGNEGLRERDQFSVAAEDEQMREDIEALIEPEIPQYQGEGAAETLEESDEIDEEVTDTLSEGEEDAQDADEIDEEVTVQDTLREGEEDAQDAEGLKEESLPRRSKRVSRPPRRFEDYVMQLRDRSHRRGLPLVSHHTDLNPHLNQDRQYLHINLHPHLNQDGQYKCINLHQ